MNQETTDAPAGDAARARRTAWRLWLCVLPAYALLVARFDHVTDDAYIAFRYARHLARGLGLSWNPGVDPPVEGFTSPLWVALMAPVEALGWDPAIASRVLSIACGVGVLRLLASVLVERLRFSTPAALLGLGWTALMPTFTFWSTGGLETMAFVLLIFACYERLLVREEQPDVAGATWAGVLAFTCRFDGLGWIAATLATAWCFGGARRRAALRAGLFIALGCGLLELARFAYFGELLPNTAHAKMSFGLFQLERGLHYVARFVAIVPSAALAVLLAFTVARRQLLSPPVAGAVVLAAATCAHALLVGGDFMYMFRFLAPAVPFLGILLAQSFESARQGARSRRTLANALALLVLIDALLPSFGVELGRQVTRRLFAGGEREARSQAALFDEGRAVMSGWIGLGRMLAAHTEPSASIVRGAIGAVGYFSERTVFDNYGLVDRELARMPAELVPSHARHVGGHDKYGSLVFFEPRRPTYAAALLVRRDEVERDNPGLVPRMFISAADKSCMSIYKPVLVPIPEYEGGDWFLLLAERAAAPIDPALWSGPLLRPENVRLR